MSRLDRRDAHFRPGFKRGPKEKRAKLRRPEIPPRADAHLTLRELAARYRIAPREAARRVKAGLLPWPIRDGHDSKRRRWLRLELDAFDRWERCQCIPANGFAPRDSARPDCENVILMSAG
jgi:hypothetical protein